MRTTIFSRASMRLCALGGWTVVVAAACFGGGGGSGGGGDGGAAPSSSAGNFIGSSGSGGSSGEGTSIGIQPPEELIVDGQSVSQGNFVLTSVIAYAFPQDAPVETVLVTESEPVIKDAQIGSSSQFGLFLAPAGTEVLHLVGYFEPVVPSLPQLPFDVTIFGDTSITSNFTIFLPQTSSQPFVYQFTGAGTVAGLEDNIDTFCVVAATPETYNDLRDVMSPGTLLTDATFFQSCNNAGSSGMQAHGTVSGSGLCEEPPDCTGGSPFCCGFPDGACITGMHCDSIACFNFDGEIPCN